MPEDVFLGVDILLHILVDIQVVGGQSWSPQPHRGSRRMEISWKLESSTTAQSSGRMDSISGSKGLPMFPPRWTVFPWAFKNSAMMEVVVVLPSLPVTA